MFRHIAVFTIGLAAIANLNAGQISIGGPNGLTSGYGVTATTTATQGAGGVYGEMTYAGSVAQSTASTSVLPTPASTLTADGVTFQMINDTANPGSNVWAGTNDGGGKGGSPATVTTTFTIPMGIFGVSNVYTMLNDEYGVSGATDMTVQFNFSTGSETFSLVNGNVIRDSFDCTAGGNLTNCSTYATGLGTGDYGTSGTAITPTAGQAYVSAFNVYTGTYSTGGTYSSTGFPYNNTSGNLYLDAQDFYVGSAFSAPTTELLSLVVTDSNSGLYQSRDELSAITVVAPEPSAVFLFVMGIGMVFFTYRRRKSAING